MRNRLVNIGRWATLAFALMQAVQADIGIISPEEAAEMIKGDNKPIVLDTRGGYKDYFRGHLPTAHHINFDTLRGTDMGVPVQYLPDDITKILLTRMGVDKNRTHIVYAASGALPNDEILSASMVAYVLEKYGVSNIKILNGGIQSYKDSGSPLTQEYFGNPPGTLPENQNTEIAISVNELIATKDKQNIILVDARPKNEYLGNDDVWLRKGHIPGAVNFHWARVMSDDNTHHFRPTEEIKPVLESEGITPDKEIIVYCGTSREGSLLRFYLKHLAKYPNVRLYEGSWKEYANLKQHPVETTEPSHPKS